MKNPLVVAFIFSVTRLCLAIAVIPQPSQTQGPTHDEDVSDLLQNFLSSSEDHVLQLPIGQESPSLGRDFLQRVLTAVHTQLVASRTTHDNDITRLDAVISRLSNDVRGIKDILAAQTGLAQTILPGPARDTDTTSDDAAAVSADRRTTSVEGLAVSSSAVTPSTASTVPDRPSQNEDEAEEHDGSGDPVAEHAHLFPKTVTRRISPAVPYVPRNYPWLMGRPRLPAYRPDHCFSFLPLMRSRKCGFFTSGYLGSRFALKHVNRDTY